MAVAQPMSHSHLTKRRRPLHPRFNMKSESRRFRVALSFPGERREFVERVAKKLEELLGKDKVFYDSDHKHELATPDLDIYLGEIYQSQADLIAPFFCAEYEKKVWCRLEWRHIRVVIFSRGSERVMPFRFDDTKIPGFLPIDGYYSIGTNTPETIALAIHKRLQGCEPHQCGVEWKDDTEVKEYYRLPSTSGLFFGRGDIFKQLDDAWTSPTVNICTLVASGGVGKTSVVKTWLDRLKENDNHGARAIYSYSFYYQGALQSRESQEAKSTGEVFLSAALEWFGDTRPERGSSVDKADRLAKLIQTRRTLLILDGLEPLQHQIKEFQGRIRDQGIQHLLTELARKNSGLCIVTSRVPVTDLKEFKMDGKKRHVELLLPNLSPNDGVALLKKTGVKGEEEQLKLAVEEFDGHALALTLLGNFLVSQFGGDVRCRDRLMPLTEEPEQGGHARRVMQSYEELFACKPELNLLYILGLFDRPAKKAAVFAVIDPTSIRGKEAARWLWNGIRNFPDTTLIKSLCLWLALNVRNIFQRLNRALSARELTAPFCRPTDSALENILRTLRSLHLVNQLDSQRPGNIDCHPLIRQHFDEAFKKRNPKGWQEAHSRLFEYYSSDAKDEQPITLEDMEPLYAAVAHGCQAGRYTEAGLTYHWRMLRGNVYSCNHLGALQSDLALLTFFFDETWSRPAVSLTDQEKLLLLYWSSTLLFTLGRVNEGLKPGEAAIKLAVDAKAWWLAATGSYYLSAARKALGNLSAARDMALQSVDYALKTHDPYWLIGPYATLGHCLHQMGLFREAKEAFQSSEKAMCQVAPEVRWLPSVWSYWYCELLLDLGDFQNAKERGEHALEQAPEQPKSSQGILLDEAVAELTISRALLLIESQAGSADFHESKEYFRKAFESIRNVNHQWLMPEALLGRAEYYNLSGKHVQAEDDLRETKALADRDGLKLYEVDCQIGLAKLSLHRKELTQAREQLNAVETEVANMGYHRRDIQIVLLQAKLSQMEGNHDYSAKQLSMAKVKAESSGGYQWLVEMAEKDLLK